jgi:pSer/pThr/pTyr-binding forkhead associated (FHA) protein
VSKVQAADRKSSYWLVGVEGKARKVRLPINTPLLVGRGASNHIVLDDPRISRQHARFAPERDGPVVYDLNSANGTIVNGVAVTKHKLAPDDVVRFGRYAFRIEIVAAEQPLAEHDIETPTLVATESVARMLVARESHGSGERPLVDLTQLEDAYQKLGTLYSFMHAISSTIEKGELLRLIAGKMREVYPGARSVGIYLRAADSENGGFVRGPSALQLAHFAGAGIVSDLEPTLRADVTSRMLDMARAIITGESQESSRVPGGTDMFAPMIDRGEVLGVIHVAADEHRPTFSPADLELLNGMATSAAMMLQNTRMHEESIARDRLK